VLLWLASTALAGQLYINGVFVDPATIAGVEMKDVSITFDASGNIQVTAPGYKIEVVDPPGGTTTPPPPTAPPVGTPSAAARPPAGAQAAPPATNSGVAPARWWLVTEDNASVGHTIDIVINGVTVKTVGSGMAQQILDVGRWLRPGANQVEVRSNSVNASGGTYYVYIGNGSDQTGTVVMDRPQVQFGVGSTRTGPYSRSYTLNVDR
jgi:hypothetical protein